MADPRTPTCPNLIKLCEDAGRLAATYPPPMVEKTGSWRPAPYDLTPGAAWLSGGMQPSSPERAKTTTRSRRSEWSRLSGAESR